MLVTLAGRLKYNSASSDLLFNYLGESLFFVDHLSLCTALKTACTNDLTIIRNMMCPDGEVVKFYANIGFTAYTPVVESRF